MNDDADRHTMRYSCESSAELSHSKGNWAMAVTMQKWGLEQLTPEDRLDLAQQLWDSAAADLQQTPLTEAQRHELERRIAAADANPNEGIPWALVRAEALARSRR
jgi:putative addiction module component (TIGR02574 family)